MKTRKIIHVDMDAFYASVERRENPQLTGVPLIIAHDAPRSVVTTASYEARPFGVHSAMPLAQAKILCPQAVIVPPDFALYRAVSRQIHAIFARYSSFIEPVALDEAYLDVSENRAGLPSATATAAAIRAEIFTQTRLTASAGVAPNKFLAKIASERNKPDGQFVIAPHQVENFVATLPVAEIPGVGRATMEKMRRLKIATLGDLRTHPLGELVLHFGRYGHRLYNYARGIDLRAVENSRERKQISNETTLPADVFLPVLLERLPELSAALAEDLARKQLIAQCITLKIKTADFRHITRSQTFSSALCRTEEILAAARQLAARIDLPAATRYRLIGIGASQLQTAGQQTLDFGF